MKYCVTKMWSNHGGLTISPPITTNPIILLASGGIRMFGKNVYADRNTTTLFDSLSSLAMPILAPARHDMLEW